MVSSSSVTMQMVFSSSARFTDLSGFVSMIWNFSCVSSKIAKPFVVLVSLETMMESAISGLGAMMAADLFLELTNGTTKNLGVCLMELL